MAADPLRSPIAIVGGGPVGLMLALLLDFYGVRCVLFNTEPTTRWHPKGGTQNARTMEHLRRLGLADKVRALGLPADQPTDVVYLTRFGGFELARIRMPSSAQKIAAVRTSGKTDQVPEPLHRANQMYVERLLLDQARTRPNITLRFGWRVTSFADDGAGVTLVAETEGGARESWRADYLVGCDGGQGPVRRELGIRYEGGEALQQAFLGGRMFSSYVRVPALRREFLRNDPAFQHWLINPEFRTAIIAVDGADEFMIWTRPSGPDGGAEDQIAVDMIRRATRPDIAVEVLGHSPWTAGVALVAERYGAGRVVLAGDAAHLFTPTGGFGMNTGVDDAANLAWKLAALVQGWGGKHLLASYESERRPIAIRNTGAARELGKSIGSVATPAEMEEDTAAGRTARLEAAQVLGGQAEQYASIGVQLGARYDGSPLIAEGGVPPTDSFTSYTAASVPGGRAPHVWLDAQRESGSSLFDRLGKGFTLLRLGPNAPDPASMKSAAAARNIPFTVLDLADHDARELYGCDLALIRPDQHVAWRGNTALANADALMAKVTGG